MRCSNIGPRGARNWFSVLDSPRQLLSPSHPDVLALREAKQVALRSARVPLAATRIQGIINTPFPRKSNGESSNTQTSSGRSDRFFYRVPRGKVIFRPAYHR